MRHAALTRHTTTPCPGLTGIDVGASLRPDGELSLTYTLAGDLGKLLIPATDVPTRRDGLWRHTCFEVFVMADNGPGYREFNFSPSGDWAAYAFASYRQGGPLVPAPEPAIVCRACDDALMLEVGLSRFALPDGLRLRLGLSAVLEDRSGTLSYWALRHPPGKPDFHHIDTFALELLRL